MCLLKVEAQNNIMCVFGDSYVKNHHCPISETWHAKVADKLGLEYLNKGINGNCIAFDRTDEGYGKAMVDRVGELPDSLKVIIIIAGHNDAGMIANNDNCTLDMFSIALNRLLSTLKEKYPNATIGYVTPWYVNRPYFEEVIGIIKEICGKHEIPVLDSATSGIEVNNPGFRKSYFQGEKDTAHLNDSGHNLIVEWGENFITAITKQ